MNLASVMERSQIAAKTVFPLADPTPLGYRPKAWWRGREKMIKKKTNNQRDKWRKTRPSRHAGKSSI
jgi:hypothetical protein